MQCVCWSKQCVQKMQFGGETKCSCRWNRFYSHIHFIGLWSVLQCLLLFIFNFSFAHCSFSAWIECNKNCMRRANECMCMYVCVSVHSNEHWKNEAYVCVCVSVCVCCIHVYLSCIIYLCIYDNIKKRKGIWNLDRNSIAWEIRDEKWNSYVFLYKNTNFNHKCTDVIK